MFREVDFRKAHISLLVSVTAMMAAFAIVDWEPSDAEHQAIVLGTFVLMAVTQVWLHNRGDRAHARRAPTRSGADAEAPEDRRA